VASSFPQHPASRHPVPQRTAPSRAATRRTRDERGVAFPSPLVMLSVIAIVMAGIAFVATKDQPAFERRIEVAGQQSPDGATAAEKARKGPQKAVEKKERADKPKDKAKKKKPVERGEVYVVVFNNSGITGLASRVATRAQGLGWNVVGSDNWYGTIDTSTVYFPAELEQAAKVLAKDLGITRTKPAIDPMQFDRLTVILTGEL
jgi:LytR cell envelope-related transcriptional attenuator